MKLIVSAGIIFLSLAAAFTQPHAQRGGPTLNQIKTSHSVIYQGESKQASLRYVERIENLDRLALTQ